MTKKLPPGRRVLRIILAALGAAILFAVIIAVVGDNDFREMILRHDWHNEDFRSVVSIFALELLAGAAFLGAAIALGGRSR